MPVGHTKYEDNSCGNSNPLNIALNPIKTLFSFQQKRFIRHTIHRIEITTERNSCRFFSLIVWRELSFLHPSWGSGFWAPIASVGRFLHLGGNRLCFVRVHDVTPGDSFGGDASAEWHPGEPCVSRNGDRCLCPTAPDLSPVIRAEHLIAMMVERGRGLPFCEVVG